MNMSQEALAEVICTTQQAVSRMENNAYDIPSDHTHKYGRQI